LYSSHDAQVNCILFRKYYTLITALVCLIMQRVVKIFYRRFGTTYWFHPQGSRILLDSCWAAFFWVITRRVMEISYRRFGTNYRSHPQGSRILLDSCWAALFWVITRRVMEISYRRFGITSGFKNTSRQNCEIRHTRCVHTRCTHTCAHPAIKKALNVAFTNCAAHVYPLRGASLLGNLLTAFIVNYQSQH
jgi:hypothetical protein